MDNLELDYLHCCNMQFHVYRFECALWRIFNDNPDRYIMDMITTCKGLQHAYAIRANELRIELIALGWD